MKKKTLTVSGLVGSGTLQDKPNPSVLTQFKDESDFIDQSIFEIPLEKITPNPYQPRIIFPQDEIDSLSQSIEETGLIQPIAVRMIVHLESYQIIAGERRWRSFKQLERSTIPCYVFVCDDKRMAIMALAENVSREGLSDYEKAKSIRRVENEFSTRTELAKACGYQREDMYRFFTFEELPAFLIEKLDVNPRLLSRNASADIVRVLSKVDEENREQAVIELINAIKLVEQNELDQTKVANHITIALKNNSLMYSENITKRDEFIIDGRKIGYFATSPNGIVIKFSKGIFDKERKIQLQQLISNFLDEVINSQK